MCGRDTGKGREQPRPRPRAASPKVGTGRVRPQGMPDEPVVQLQLGRFGLYPWATDQTEDRTDCSAKLRYIAFQVEFDSALPLRLRSEPGFERALRGSKRRTSETSEFFLLYSMVDDSEISPAVLSNRQNCLGTRVSRLSRGEAGVPGLPPAKGGVARPMLAA